MVAKLIVNPSSASRREIPLPRTVLSIGRDPGNDLVLADAMVSRRHAVVELRGSQYFIRDCNSSNGSLVNGDRISERSLRDGDLVAIGTARILFRDEVHVEDASGKVVQHPSSPRLSCATCGADYRKGDLYCRQCGAAIAPPPPAKAVCAACGTAVPLPAKFCSACGLTLPEAPEAQAPPVPPVPEAPAPAPASGGPGARASAAPIAEAPTPETPAVPVPASMPVPAPVPKADASGSQPLPELDLVLEPANLPRAPRTAVAPSLKLAPSPMPAAWRPVPARAAVAALAPLPARAAAGFIDMGVAVLVQFLLLGPVAWYWWGHEFSRDPDKLPYLPILLSVALVPVALLVTAAYFVHGWGVSGATPGKRLLGLAVETDAGVSPIGVSRAATRFFGYLVSGLFLGLGFLMIAFTGAGLHDRLAGTRVVRRDE